MNSMTSLTALQIAGALMDSVRLNYTINDELGKALVDYCDVTGRTASDVVRQLIHEFLEGDRSLPAPSVINARNRDTAKRDRRTDLWISIATFNAFHDRLESDGYVGKSPAIAHLLTEFLISRSNHTAEELVRVTSLIDRDTYSYLSDIANVRKVSTDQLVQEIVRNHVNKLKSDN